MKKNLVNILLVAALVIGVGLLAYPSVSNWVNMASQTRVINSYEEVVSGIDKSKLYKMRDDAVDYNKKLTAKSLDFADLSESERKEYDTLLDPTGLGVMGYVSIPAINCNLPIYHGTDEKNLINAVGHIEWSSLPVGGESTHCVVSGHRGLPSAMLFTDLDRLVEGDYFMLNVLDETLTYEVDQIRIVLPEDLDTLKIEEGQDYCTLVTCTPYGINSHRLLVRGHRVANPNGDALVTADAVVIESYLVAPIVAAPLIVLVVLWVVLDSRRRKVSAFMESNGFEKERQSDGE